MINATLNNSAITFEQVTRINTDPKILIMFLIAWLLPLLIYFLIGCIKHAKTSSGRKLDSLMIQTTNFWIAFMVWFLIQPILILTLIMFPLWLKIF